MSKENPKVDRVYEVLHTIACDGKLYEPGSEIRASELPQGDVEKFLAIKVIADPGAAIETASTDVAHDRLARIAHKLGLVTVKGSEYSLAGKKSRGVTEFRKNVTLDDLENAIVAHFDQVKDDLEAARKELVLAPPTKES